MEHVDVAPTKPHPTDDPPSYLPQDVRAAIQWVAARGTDTNQLRIERLDALDAIAETLSKWSSILWNQATAAHVRDMRAYRPHLAFIHAMVKALRWPHTELVLDLACGAQPLGCIGDTGVWREVCPRPECEDWRQLMTPEAREAWNNELYASIRHEGLKPENQELAWATWRRCMEEVDAGWSTPVVGGWTELNTRFPQGVRLMRRFGVLSSCGKCRCADSGTKSGHNPCTSLPERLANVRADFPMEVAAAFAKLLPIDGSWTMNLATNDMVAAFRRCAVADPSVTIVAQWDPRPESEGGQRVQLFYVQGFNFGLKSAVLAYNNLAEFQTRAAVRLLPIVACHYFDDWCCAEPSNSCANAQRVLRGFMRLTGVDLDGVDGRNGQRIPAKEQAAALVAKFLGVVTDFAAFAQTGAVTMYVPQARIDKVRAEIVAAIARGELSAGEASSMCGKLQFALSWCVGRFGRAALGPLYRQAHARGNRINVALEMSLHFLEHALGSLRARRICVAATGTPEPPVLIWSDATGTDGNERAQVAFVARFPGGVPAPADPPGPVPEHPRWVHGALAVSDALLSELEARRQQVGQLELLAAVAAYYSMAPWLERRKVLHFIDNTAAACGIAKGYSAKCDSARIIHTYHALNVPLQAQVHFEWVKSEANIADLPSRGHFELLHDFGSRPIELKIPPISDWLSPAEAARAAGGGFGRERGGRRGR